MISLQSYNIASDGASLGLPADDIALVTCAIVRRTCGNISYQSLWRWLNKPSLHFPRPVQISGRNYWRSGDIRAWLASRSEVAS